MRISKIVSFGENPFVRKGQTGFRKSKTYEVDLCCFYLFILFSGKTALHLGPFKRTKMNKIAIEICMRDRLM